jgi:hypothetical protein
MAYQPKSYRKFLATSLSAVVAVSAAAPLVASAATTSFTDVPAGAWYAGSLANLVDAGIIGGVGNNKFDPTGEVTRTQLAKMLVYAAGLDENEAVADPGFSDVKTSDWFYKDVAVAAAHGLMNGMGNGTFGVDATLTRDQMATAIVNAFNLRGSVDTSTVTLPYTDLAGSAYTNDIKVLYGLGVLQNTTNYNPSTTVDRQTFVAFLDKTLTAVANQSPKVTSVSAVNGSQLLVKFNNAVNAVGNTGSSAANPANYSIAYAANTVTSAEVQADGKSVLLTLGAAVPNNTTATYSLTVSGVTLADATTVVPTYATVVKVNDTVAPTVTGVKSVTNGATATSATVTFSEPVTSGYLIFDGGTTKYSVNAGTSQTISGLSLDSSKAHTVEYVNLTDGSGNVTTDATTSFTVTKDAVSPVITNVSAYNDNKVLVTFSKEMPTDVAGNLVKADGSSITLASTFQFKDEALADLGTVTSVKALAGDTTGTKFVVDFGATSAIYTNSNTRNLQLVVTGDVLTDTLGNKLAATIKPVSLTKDTVAPVLTGVTVQKDTDGNATSFTFNYSEPVSAPTGTVTIVNKDGVLLTPASANAGADGKSVVVPVSGLTGTISVSYAAGFVADTALTPNDVAAYSGTVDLGTPASATVHRDFGANPVSVTGSVITVTFPTAVKGGVGADSATNPSNYVLNGKALPAGTSITLNPAPSAQTVATITLPAGTITADTSAAVFKVNAGIAGLDGSVVNALTTTLSINDNTAPVLQSAHLVSTNGTSTATFELTYSEAMVQTLSNSNVFDELVIKDSQGNVVGTAAVANDVAGFSNKVDVVVTGAVSATDTYTVTTKASATADLTDNSLGLNAEKTGVTVTAQ